MGSSDDQGALAVAMEEPTCAIVTFGPTQSGKSTTLGKLALSGEFAPKTGTGDGESCTEEAQVIQTQLGIMVDTPGVNDSRLRFTDDEAGRRVALGMATTKADEVKFMVFESLANDSVNLRLTAEKQHRSFGSLAARATLVIATKADKLDDDEKGPRLRRVQEAAEKLGFGGVVLWQNKGLSAEGEQRQLEQLREALARLPSTKMTALEDLKNRIAATAEELCAKQTPIHQTKMVSVTREYQEPYEDTEIVEVPYTVDQNATFTYDVDKSTFSTEKETKKISVPCRGLSGLFGYEEDREVEFDKPVYTPKTETKTHHYKVKAIEYRTEEKPVTKYRKKEEQVQQPHHFTTYLPVKEFMAEARELVVEEIRSSLRCV